MAAGRPRRRARRRRGRSRARPPWPPTAPDRQRAAPPGRRGSGCSEVGEHLVTGGVSAGVVELLEVVEVEEDDGVAGLRIGQPPVEVAAVRQTGERVGVRGSAERGGQSLLAGRQLGEQLAQQHPHRAHDHQADRDGGGPGVQDGEVRHGGGRHQPQVGARGLGQPGVGEAEHEQPGVRRGQPVTGQAQERQCRADQPGEQQRGAAGQPVPGQHQADAQRRGHHHGDREQREPRAGRVQQRGGDGDHGTGRQQQRAGGDGVAVVQPAQRRGAARRARSGGARRGEAEVGQQGRSPAVGRPLGVVPEPAVRCAGS